MAWKGSAVLRRRWARLLAEWRASGWGPGEYCRRLGVKPWQFYYWRQRLREAEEVRPGFLPVRLVGGGEGEGRGKGSGGAERRAEGRSGRSGGGYGVGARVGPAGAAEAAGALAGAGGAAGALAGAAGGAEALAGSPALKQVRVSRVRVRLRNGRVLSFAAALPAEWAGRLADALEAGRLADALEAGRLADALEAGQSADALEAGRLC